MLETKVRTTVHSGRRRSTGEAYNPKHNSRSGGIGSHVLANPERRNIYITLDFDGNPTLHDEVDFEAHEKVFYEVFRPSLDAQNARYRKKGNYDRIKTLDEYREAHPPEEIILQVGNKDQEVPPEVTRIAVARWIDKMTEAFGKHYKICDVSIHYDEPGTGGGICADGKRSKNLSGHAHVRIVWCADGKDGLVASESKALAQMGITHDESRARSRYNHPKMAFTQNARDLFNQLVEEQNINIEKVPARPGKKTMTKEQYITEQLREEKKELEFNVTELSNECADIRFATALEAQRMDELTKEVEVLAEKKSLLERTLKGLEKAVEQLKKTVLPIQKFFERLASIRLGKDRSALDELLLNANITPAYDAIKELDEER